MSAGRLLFGCKKIYFLVAKLFSYKKVLFFVYHHWNKLLKVNYDVQIIVASLCFIIKFFNPRRHFHYFFPNNWIHSKCLCSYCSYSLNKCSLIFFFDKMFFLFFKFTLSNVRVKNIKSRVMCRFEKLLKCLTLKQLDTKARAILQ